MTTRMESPQSILNRCERNAPVYDQDRAARAWSDLEAASRSLESDQARTELVALLQHPRGRDVLAPIFANSGYLTRLAGRISEDLPDIFFQDPDELFDQSIRSLDRLASSDVSLNELMTQLRRNKERTAFLIAAADISGRLGFVSSHGRADTIGGCLPYDRGALVVCRGGPGGKVRTARA